MNMIDQILEMNKELQRIGQGFTINPEALEYSPQESLDELAKKVSERYDNLRNRGLIKDINADAQTDDESPAEQSVENPANSEQISAILDLADTYSLDSIYMGVESLPLMSDHLESLESSEIAEILEALRAISTTGSLSPRYACSLDEKIHMLVQHQLVKLTELRNFDDNRLLELWENQVFPTLAQSQAASANEPTYTVGGDLPEDSTDGDEWVESDSGRAEPDGEAGCIELEEDASRAELEDDAMIALDDLQECDEIEGELVLPSGKQFDLMGENAYSDLSSLDDADLRSIIDFSNSQVSMLSDDFEITNEDLDDHLEDPQFDEFDTFLSPVTVSNDLVVNFPVNSTTQEIFNAGAELRKALSEVRGYVYENDELVPVDAESINCFNITSSKTNGWFAPAISDIINYLNSVNGNLSMVLGEHDNALEYASSLGDSVNQVMEILPQRSCFGQLVHASGVVDPETGEATGGLDEAYATNNYLSVNSDVDNLEINIVNHLNVFAYTVHHESTQKAISSLISKVEKRATLLDVRVTVTFTFDAVEAMDAHSGIISVLKRKGFQSVSRSHIKNLIERGESDEALELFGLTEESGDYELDVLFDSGDLLVYKNIS